MAFKRQRFESKINRSGTHHLWMGSHAKSGGGHVRIDGSIRTVAQVAWELEHGELEEGPIVRSCPEEALCVRVDHLTVESRITAPPAPKSLRSYRGGGSITETAPGK